MESIGVTSIDPWYVLDDESLIRNLLYFDKLNYHIGSRDVLERFCATLPIGLKKFKEKINEIEKLEAAGLVREYDFASFSISKAISENDQAAQYALKALELGNAFSTTNKKFDDVFIDFLSRFREIGQLNSRVYSILNNNKDKNVYTPIIKNKYHNFPTSEYYSTSSVLSVLLKKFPILSDDIDLNRFIEFKSDSNTQLKLSRLKNWVLEISKANYSEKEIEQKIEYLLNEYTKQLEIHNLKYRLGYVETFVTISLEVLENLIKLNFSKAAKILFDLKKQDLTLLEAEQTLVGKELALIHDLQQNRL